MSKKIIIEAGRRRGGRGGLRHQTTSVSTIAKNPVRVAVLPGVSRERAVRAAAASSGPSQSPPAAQVVAGIQRGIVPASKEAQAAGDALYQNNVGSTVTDYQQNTGRHTPKPKIKREPGLSKKDAAALGVKTIGNVATKHRVAGAEAEAHPGAPRFHSGNPDEARPEVPELTGAALPARTSYGVSPKNAEISGDVADSGLLGHQPLSKLTAKTVEIPSYERFPGDDRTNAILQALDLPKEAPAQKVTVVSPRGRGPARSAAGYAAATGANVTDEPKRPLKNSIEGFANLLEYILILKAKNIGKQGWVPLKTAGESRPTPAGPPGGGKRPIAGFVRGPRRHYTQSGGEVSSPQAKERAQAEFDALFGQEEYMDPNKVANNIIREAFTGGARRNTTPNSNGLSDKGGTARLMLSAEWFGSPTWAFDQSTSQDFEKSAQLQATQAVNGQGEGTSSAPSMMDSVSARDIVDNLLEDSPASIYDDPESVGYMIRVLGEAGYKEFAARCAEICENATEETVVEISKMIEKLEADKADPYLVEGLQDFAALIISENEGTGTPTEEAAPSESEDQPEPPSETPAE